MPRKSLPNVGPRTIRVHIPTYNKILDFFGSSPSGMRGSDAIRQLLIAFGNYCDDQMKAGRTASAQDLEKAETLVTELFGNTNGRPQG